MAQGVSVFFYPQGTYFTLDLKQNNIPEECGEWYIIVLQDMLRRGVVDNNTIVKIPGVYNGTVGQLRTQRNF